MVLFLKNLLKARSTCSVGAVLLIFKWKRKRWSGFKITKNVINNAHTSIASKSSMQANSSISPSIEISGAMNAWLPLFKTCSTVLQKNVCFCCLWTSFSKISELTYYWRLFICYFQIHSLQVANIASCKALIYLLALYLCVQCPFHANKELH